MSNTVTYRTNLTEVDWAEMKSSLALDHFDNGRTPDQLRRSFEKSYAAVIAYASARIIGTARALSDGVCNAYIVDVWTISAYRRCGVARHMMQLLESKLAGQHVYLFTDDTSEFYKKLGYKEQPVGLGKVVGQWLQNNLE